MWKTITDFFKQNQRATAGEDSKDRTGWPNYAVDEDELVEVLPEGMGKRYPCTEIEHVGILTTEDGPWCEDLFWIIRTSLGDICITNEQAANIELTRLFKHLPGFSWEASIRATTCTSEAQFVCWDKSWQLKSDDASGKSCAY